VGINEVQAQLPRSSLGRIVSHERPSSEIAIEELPLFGKRNMENQIFFVCLTIESRFEPSVKGGGGKFNNRLPDSCGTTWLEGDVRSRVEAF
jgi:hypothetical protein